MKQLLNGDPPESQKCYCKPAEMEAMVTDDKGLTDSHLSFRDDNYMKCVYLLMRVS